MYDSHKRNITNTEVALKGFFVFRQCEFAISSAFLHRLVGSLSAEGRAALLRQWYNAVEGKLSVGERAGLTMYRVPIPRDPITFWEW